MKQAATLLTFMSVFIIASPIIAIPRGSVHAISCAPQNAAVAAVRIEQSIWITRDTGQTWQFMGRLPTAQIDQLIPQSIEEESSSSLPFEDEVEQEDQPANTARALNLDLLTAEEPLANSAEYERLPDFLAVSDAGQWAASSGSTLFVGGPRPGITQSMLLPNLRGLTFDREGRLFAASSNALVLLSRSRQGIGLKKKWPLSDPGRPIALSKDALIAVSLSDGFATITESSEGELQDSIYHRGPIQAIGQNQHGELFVVSSGFVTHILLNGSEQRICRAPAHPQQLFVDSSEHIYIASRTGAWSMWRAGSWHLLSSFDLAVDAAGRLWLGTAVGPVPPQAGMVDEFAQVPETVEMGPFGMESARMNLNLGRPPCWNPLLGLIPTVRFSLSLGRGGSAQVYLPQNKPRLSGTIWFYAGIALTWSEEPHSPVECAMKQREFVDRQNRQIKRTAELLRRWRQAKRRSTLASTLESAAQARLEIDQLTELIVIEQDRRLR